LVSQSVLVKLWCAIVQHNHTHKNKDTLNTHGRSFVRISV